MAAETGEARPSSPAELVLPGVWIVGALASYFAGALFEPLATYAGLAITFAVTLVLAKRAAGWRAFPAMCVALALQAPLLVGLGRYALRLPLGHDPYPCFFFHGSHLEEMIAFAVVAVLSAPVGGIVRMGSGSLRRLRRLARTLAPFATSAAAVLFVLGAARLARFPSVDRYFDSLPLFATIPKPQGQPCTPIEDKRDPKHDSGWDRSACATPDFTASPLSFHYHVEGTRSKWYSLQGRTPEGRDRWVPLWFWGGEPGDLPVRRDARLGSWVVRGPRGDVAVVTSKGPRWTLELREISDHVAPPLAWTAIALAGLLAALACFGASAALGELDARGDERQAWLDARRGDLSLAALAALLCSSALLLAALVDGFLV